MIDSDIYEQQALIEDTARRFFEEKYAFENRAQFINSEPGYCLQQWQEMADLGWFYLPIGTQFGGLGGGASLVSILAKEFGRALYCSPYLSNAVLSARLIEQTIKDPVRSEWLNAIGSGKILCSAALYEPQSRYDLDNIHTIATSQHTNTVLNGRKTAVLYGNVAAYFLVLARQYGDSTSSQKKSLYAVPKSATGLHLINYTAHDGSKMSELVLDNVCVEHQDTVNLEVDATSLVMNAVQFANTVACAQLVGIMEESLAMTLDYVKTRSQFGNKLGSFQTLQHRLVDMYMRCQLADSMSLEANRVVDTEQSHTVAQAIVSATKADIAESAILNTEEAIQMHGAMGMMDELKVGHFLKQAFVLAMLFGNADYHKSQYRRLRLQQSVSF